MAGRVHPYAGLDFSHGQPAASSDSRAAGGALSAVPLRTASQRSGGGGGLAPDWERHPSQRRLQHLAGAEGRPASLRSDGFPPAAAEGALGSSLRQAGGGGLGASQRQLLLRGGGGGAQLPSSDYPGQPGSRPAPLVFELAGGSSGSSAGGSAGSSSGGGGGWGRREEAPLPERRAGSASAAAAAAHRALNSSSRALDGHARRRAALARRRWLAACAFVRAAVRFALLPAQRARASAAAEREARRARILSRKRSPAELTGLAAAAVAAAAAAAAAAPGAPPPPPQPLLAPASAPSPLALLLASALCGGGGVPYAVSPLAPAAAGAHFPSLVAPYLLLGDARDAANAPLLMRLGVTHVLNAAAHTPPAHADDYIYLQLPLLDTPEQPLLNFLPAAVAFIHEARASGGLVLVHCQMGISRSVACVLAWLTLREGGDMSLAAAWRHLRARRPCALPNAGFRVALALWELAQRGRSSVLHLEKSDALWDVREWRGHSDRLREVAREEEAAREAARLGWRGRALAALAGAWRGAARLLAPW